MRFTRFTLFSFFVLFTSLANAQNSTNSPRITSPIVESQLVTLHGNVPVKARAEFDRGTVSSATQMTHMRLVLSRSAAQKAGLDALMEQQLNLSSPNYHKWLTPAEYGEHYGANSEDIHTITAWLQSRGFTLERVDSGRMSIAFTGTVEQVENAFHTQMHQFNAKGESFISNITDPQIPAALASVVAGVFHLNTIQPKAENERALSAKYDGEMHKFMPLSATGKPQPELTSGSAGNYFLYVTPQDAATIYNSPLNASFPGTSANDGTGITIGIGGDSLILGSTFWNYRNLFLGQTIPAAEPPTTEPCAPASTGTDCVGSVAVTKQGQLTIFNVDGVAENGDSDEAYIDTELSGGIAPGANIYFYTSSDLFSGVVQAISDNTVNVFSLSFGGCEQNQGTSGNQFLSQMWQQAASQGISVFVSTGDSGSAGCDDDNTESVSTYGLAVNGIASTPYNVAVGGTDFYPLVSSTTFGTYVGTTNGKYLGSALKFIPESTWNNSTSNNTTIADNAIVTAYSPNIVGGSGGISSCATLTVTNTCQAGYAKPYWQVAPGVPADGVRDLPDVSLFAANGYVAPDTWIICTDDSNDGIISNCVVSGGNFYASGFGGTSTSAPATAGIFALLAQSQKGSIGLPNPKLYSLTNSANAASIFNDTVVGNNSVPCSTAPIASQCAATTSTDLYLTGYNTGTGYDLATGLGSLNITNLINAWAAAGYTSTTTLTITPPSPLTPSTAFTVGVTVSGSATDGGAPTGTVSLTIGSYNGTDQTLVASGNDGTASFSVPGSTLASGNYTVSVKYNGDDNYATQTGTTPLVIQAPPATVTFGGIQATLYQSATLPVAVTVTGVDTPSGTVTLTSGSYSSGPQNLVNGVLNFTIPAWSFAAGNETISAAYSGDANNGPANATTTSSVAVTASTFSVALSAVTVSAGAASGNTSTVTVTPSGQYAGNVTFTAAVTASPAGAVYPPTFSYSPALTFTTGSSAVQTGTITVLTTAASSSAVKARLGMADHSQWLKAAGGTILASFLLFLVPGARKWRKSMMALLFIIAASFTIMGCNGGGSKGGGIAGTTTGTYTITVTASGTQTGGIGTVTPAAQTFTLTVN